MAKSSKSFLSVLCGVISFYHRGHGGTQRVSSLLLVIRLFLVPIDELRLAGLFALCLSPDKFERVDVSALTFAVFDLFGSLLFSFGTRRIIRVRDFTIQAHVLFAIIEREPA